MRREPDLEPVTVESDDDAPFGRLPDVEREKEADAERLRDREVLREHREKLLASQSLTAKEMDIARPAKSPRADFAIAAIYTLYAVPMAVWVLGLGTSQGHFWTAAAIAAVAFCFLVMLWRQYSRAWLRIRRSRVYVGKLVEKRNERTSAEHFNVTAVFEGGEVELPWRIQKELIPGVRYRVHAPETEDVAVDVALDDEEPERRSAYR